MACFAERLKELRLSNNLTQPALADEVQLSKSMISMYEQGERKPSVESQEVIADYFNVDIDYLMGRSDRTTIVLPVVNANPKRRYLMDRIAKADDKQLNKISRLMELIDDEETNNA